MDNSFTGTLLPADITFGDLDSKLNQLHKCVDCPLLFTTDQDVLQHRKTCHQLDPKFQCSWCPFIFMEEKEYYMHVNNIHTSSKPKRKSYTKKIKNNNFKCTFCGKIFSTYSSQLRHIRSKHTFERPFKCKLCSYASVERQKLKIHMRSHTDERPYSCTFCSKKFRSSPSLNRHLKTHSDTREYMCILCFNKFSIYNTLVNHMRTVHCVEKKHWGKPCSTDVNGYPKSVEWFLKKLGNTIEDGFKSLGLKKIRYYNIHEQYLENASVHFKSLSEFFGKMDESKVRGKKRKKMEKTTKAVETEKVNGISDYMFIHYELEGEDIPLKSEENKDSKELEAEFEHTSEEESQTKVTEVNAANKDLTENCYVEMENVERFERLSELPSINVDSSDKDERNQPSDTFIKQSQIETSDKAMLEDDTAIHQDCIETVPINDAVDSEVEKSSQNTWDPNVSLNDDIIEEEEEIFYEFVVKGSSESDCDIVETINKTETLKEKPDKDDEICFDKDEHVADKEQANNDTDEAGNNNKASDDIDDNSDDDIEDDSDDSDWDSDEETSCDDESDIEYLDENNCICLVENVQVQRILLQNMKAGAFGFEPRVVKVTEDGSVSDISHKYSEHFPVTL